MEGLLRRISAEGTDAENALRVIAFFDELVEHRSPPDALIRSTARLIGAPAGFISASGRSYWTVDGFGRPMGPSIPPGARRKEVHLDGGFSGTVWILPDTSNDALAEIVLERMSISASIILSRDWGERADAEGASLLRLLDDGRSEEERTDEARLLGFRQTSNVRSLCFTHFASDEIVLKAVAQWSKLAGTKCVAQVIDTRSAVAIMQDSADAARGLVVAASSWPFLTAVGPSVSTPNAHVSLGSAREAARLCRPDSDSRVIEHDLLGPLRFVASVPPAKAANDPMVIKLRALQATESGRAEVAALEAYCRHQSLRGAASRLNLHHSSLASRLESVSKRLDLDVNDPHQRFEATLSLFLLRIAESE